MYFTPNQVGSTTTLTGAAGWVQDWYTYQPFGQTTQSNAAFTNPFQFTGREDDGTVPAYFGRSVVQDPKGDGP